MNAKYLLIILLLSVGLVSSCSDDDSFTTSSQHRLVFSEDTIKLDTVFSNVPTPAKSFWVYNKSGDGLRCTILVHQWVIRWEALKSETKIAFVSLLS